MANKSSNGSIESLENIKKTIDEVIDKKILKAKLNEAISSIDCASFACLNYIFENISSKLYGTLKGKKLIKKYIKTIKESKELKTNYRLFDIINKPNSINNPYIFLKESLAVIKSVNNEKYHSDIKHIVEIIKESIIEAGLSYSEINDIVSSYDKTISQDVDFILSENFTIENSTKYSNKITNIVNFITENKKNVGNSEIKKNTKELLSDINKMIYENNNSWESSLVRDVVINNLAGKTNKELFETYKKDCLEILKDAIENKTPEESSRFTMMEGKLKDKTFNAEFFEEDMAKLAELKYVLKS